MRGLIAGMLGAFAGGGLVIGLATRFVKDMGAGAPGYGMLFVAVFTGMAAASSWARACSPGSPGRGSSGPP